MGNPCFQNSDCGSLLCDKKTLTCCKNIYHNIQVFFLIFCYIHYLKDQNNLEGVCAVNTDCTSNNCAYSICSKYLIFSYKKF